MKTTTSIDRRRCSRPFRHGSNRRRAARRPCAPRGLVLGAGNAPARSSSARSLADCTVKLPEMMPAAAEDRLADDRRADHLVVEHDRERLADILARRVAEPPGAGGVEPEADRRLVVPGKLGCASTSMSPTPSRACARHTGPARRRRVFLTGRTRRPAAAGRAARPPAISTLVRPAGRSAWRSPEEP